MIFVTVGTQLPFERLIGAVDRWAGESGRADVFAQTCSGTTTPEHLEWVAWLDPTEFRKRAREASLIVSHAGMGSVLTALEFNKPIVVLPRRVVLGEHRNDHQVATARWLASQGRVQVAMDERELITLLENGAEHTRPGEIRPWASEGLLDAIRGFLSTP